MAQIADLLDILAPDEDENHQRSSASWLRRSRPVRRRAPHGDRRAVREARHRSPDHRRPTWWSPVARRLHQASPGQYRRRSAAGVANRRRRPRRTTVDQLFIANTHDWILLLFSDRGARVLKLKGLEVPEGSTLARQALVNMFPLRGEKITVAPLTPGKGSRRPLRLHRHRAGHGEDLARPSSATPQGRHHRGGPGRRRLPAGITALTDGKHDVMLFSDGGKRCASTRTTCPDGPQARGVRGMALERRAERDRGRRHAGRRGRRRRAC